MGHYPPVPSNQLTEAERERIVTACNTPRFASLPPSRIVPRLADEGTCIASESSFCRVLRERGQSHRRGRARPSGRTRPPASFEAKAPCEVWSRDITWLPGPVAGLFFYLSLIVDIYSRKIIGREVYECESAELAAGLPECAVRAEGGLSRPLILHADNGSPMKGATMKVTMERLGVTASFSRPRVSNDTPFSEALFRTCKYVPSWPAKGVASIEEARLWGQGFARRYNTGHRHSAIRFVTPEARHRGEDADLLANRRAVYQAAKEKHPARWSGRTRNRQPVGSVWLNPDRADARHEGHGAADALPHEAGSGGPMAGAEKSAA